MTIRMLLLATLMAASVHAQKEEYPLHEDSKQHPDVPAGNVIADVFDKSKVFPGTTRDYWVYVPQQYDASKPAARSAAPRAPMALRPRWTT